MNRERILNDLKLVIAPYTENKAMLNTISDDTDLICDLKINSANLIDIVIEAESRYHIEIDADAIEKMTRVGNAIDIIIQKTDQAA